MLKYGDYFLKLEIAEKFGVYNVLPYTVYNMSRHEGANPEKPSEVQFSIDPDGLMSNADPNYTTPERIVRFISLDSTEAGFIVYALDEQTDEAGGDAQVTIQLKSKPKADVIISASSTDTTKAVITQGSFLTFTISNWFQPQTIKLTGLADGSTANDQDYSLEFSNSSSDDINYDGLKIQSVPLKHLNLN